MRTTTIVTALLLAVPLGAQEPDARKLFLDNCARCHGENGDGQGTTELDRPARSFQDGGFSYGNTPEALFRTISGGIPGTPMPGFDTSLGEAQRYALANYVTTLGPEVRAVTLEETILVVADRPEIVRGMLPAIADGAVAHPRGLLIGTTSGLTFEYRVDDVRLLGVRQGAFVERTDWTGRGGSALKPLGLVVHLEQGGDPEPLFQQTTEAGPVPLRAKLASSWIRGTQAGLGYALHAHGPALATVEEAVTGYGAAFGAGFRRRFALHAGESEVGLVLDLPRTGDGEVLETFLASDPAGEHQARGWKVVQRPGVVECVGAVLVGAPAGGLDGRLSFVLGPDASAELHVVTLLVPAWTQEVRDGLAEVSFP